MTDRIVNLKDEAGNLIYPVGLAPSGTVTTSMLNDSSVTTAKVADDAVTTAKIADDAVTAAKLASDAVSAANIADSAVTNAKIASGAIDASKIAPLGGAYSLVAASSVAVASGADFTTATVTVAGDYRISGTLWVAPGTGMNTYAAIGIKVNSGNTLTINQTKISGDYDQKCLHVDYIATLNANDVVHLINAQSDAMEANNISLIVSRWLG